MTVRTVSVRTTTRITPANPHLACDECGERVEQFDAGVGPPTNRPCGHHAGYTNTCPEWGPVDGPW